MKIKMLLCLAALALAVFTASGFSHVAGYTVIANESAPVPTINGVLAAGEWAGADCKNFGLLIAPQQVCVKKHPTNPILYIAFNITTPSDSAASDGVNDEVRVLLDLNNDDGTAPQPDDMNIRLPRGDSCIYPNNIGFDICWFFRGRLDHWEWRTDGHFSAVAREVNPFNPTQGWIAEFEIHFDNIPAGEISGIGFYSYDNFSTGFLKFSWPLFINLNSPNTWGDLYWPGELSASEGAANPQNHNWHCDPLDLYNEMLQIDVSAQYEDVALNEIKLADLGAVNLNDIAEIVIVNDVDNNGRYDSGDVFLGNGTYPPSGEVEISLSNAQVPAGGAMHVLIAYRMDFGTQVGRRYSFELPAHGIRGTGVNSGAALDAATGEFYSAEKTVVAAPTTLSLGPANPGDHDFDPATADDYNEMLQFAITAPCSGSATFNSITLRARGSGDDRDGIDLVYLVLDVNDNGEHDSGDTVLGSSHYTSNNQNVLTITIGGGHAIPAGTAQNFLISYEISSDVDVGDIFYFFVDGLSVTDPSGTVIFSNLPLESAEKTISECAGAISLSLDPTTADAGDPVTATISGLTGCTGQRGYVRLDSCSGTTLCNFTVGSGGSCDFSAPSSIGTNTCFACIDMDGDGSYDANERDSAVLSVTGAPMQCLTNDDCNFDKYCGTDGYCHAVTGTCGYPQNHRWVNYECCEDTDCLSGQTCENHECVGALTCDTNADCPTDKYCSANICVLVVAATDCGDRINHQWVPYECCENDDCADDEYCAVYAHGCRDVQANGTCGTRANHTWIQYECCVNADCINGTCQNNVCIYPSVCASDADCGPSEFCNLQTSRCEARAGFPWWIVIVIILVIAGGVGFTLFFLYQRGYFGGGGPPEEEMEFREELPPPEKGVKIEEFGEEAVEFGEEELE